MNHFDKEFWTQRYKEGTTGWDIGYPSAPLKEYIDQLADKNLKILIPGAGNAYEVEYLWNQGFKNVFVLDISRHPLEEFQKRNPGFPEKQVLLMDFFDVQDHFDLVLEQTFFCAINKDLRMDYAKKMYGIIRPGGKLVGVLFGVEFEKPGPPFGGSKEEYRQYFEPYFEIRTMETCTNSIPPRAGNELFIQLIRK